MTMGLVVVAIGLIMLAGQLDWHLNIGRLWPVIFVLIGVGKFASSDEDARGSGVFFLFLGAIFLMHTFRIFTLNHSWPLFIVLGGVSMIFHRDRRHSKRDQVQP